ncbi:laminin subunit alpha-3 isoform X2 [Siniperca chuatsi]|uniref:laminin subunit alpha-3 isoform X2 n=1 Tax=Siniperca chuatsi TaxID=119488 RepID=UPI001CE1007D|nr:laminin subunit alpha-3 isoform X2 [Siniperca chuatsi]
MQWNISLLCCVVWLILLCFAPVCPSAEKHSKCKHRHDRYTQIHQKTHSTKRLCDPSFSNQTAGAITQKCSSGFYREQAGPYRGQCVPCSCNGLSNECDEHTGNCVNCQFNTTGDRCERCEEGYYGNAANRTCRACPCPFTWNNFALACLDIGSGVVECLCKRNYSGSRCERCAFGFYGNPMMHGGSCKPCNCKDGTSNICDSLTGECITSGDSSCGDDCHECDGCAVTLLVDLERMDDALAQLKQQLQSVTNGAGSLSRLNHLEANISESKILFGRYNTAVRRLDPKVEQLEAHVDVVGDGWSQLIDETLATVSDLETILQNVNGTKLKAEDLLSETEALITAIQDLIKQLTEVKPGESVTTLSENNKARGMDEAQRIVQEMRERGCTAQRDNTGREQEEAHKLLDIIRNNMAVAVETNQAVLNQTADSLMASDSSLREVAELPDAEDRVNRTQGLYLKSRTMLQHLEHLHTQLEREQSALLPVTEMTKDLLKNITNICLMLEEVKKEFENPAAQLDYAKLEFIKLNNIFQIVAKVDIVTKAEEHAEELDRVAAEFQQVLHNATNSTELLSVLGIGAYYSIINGIEKAEMAANQSRVAADQALMDVEERGLVNRAEGLKDNLTCLWTDGNKTQSDLEMLSHTVNTHKDRVNKQKAKGESLRMGISTVSDDIKKIKRDDTEVLIESAKTAASASNSTVSDITERLRNISQEVERITLTNVSVNIDDMLTDADQALENLNTSLPALKDKITQVEALSGNALPCANMTESIRRIKDVIEETRNFVNRLSIATTFNGKSHVELHPPRNLEDIKAFTAVDLLLNRFQNSPSKADYRRMRRQDKHKDDSFFVLYLGDKEASGDYIGMAIRSNVLICVYKLGGVVHEVETSQITTTTNLNSSDFDRVIFHRYSIQKLRKVYQDAEVNITQNFTSQKPVSLSPKRNLPNTMTGILELDPNNVVFYVGGYPEDFTPPVELHYPKYRGVMKLSYINDNPVCLFNYKRAVNMDAKQSTVKIPQSEVSDYYEGTGYRMAFIKEPDKIKRRLFKFHINSRETNALLFYIGNKESFFCVFVERGILVLQAEEAGRELRVQSAEKVSLFDKHFAIAIADTFIVHYGPKQISTDHNQTNYMRYYIGGLPAQLRQRHNITAPPLRGCVDHLTVDAEIVKYNRTIGVSDGCPVSLLGVRSATLDSALSVDSLLVGGEQTLRVCLGFRSTDRHGTLIRSSSQGSTSVHDLQLSLADGYAVFNSDNYTLTSDKRYSDGSWHYLSAVRRPTGLELSIDNVKVIQGLSPHIRPVDRNLQGGKFTGCITNLYTSRSEQSFIPADLSSFSLTGDAVFGLCSLPPHTKLLPGPQKHTPAPAGSQCRHWRAHRGEYQLSEGHSWLSYTLPQQDLNHRPHFSLDIKTKSSKGLILHVAGRGVVPLLALYMANGKIKMSLGENRIIQHKQKSNDGNWHRVEFSVEKSTFHLLVDGIRVTDGHLPNNEGSSLDLHNPAYLGGDLISKTTKGHNVPMNSVIGCIRNFKMNEEVIGEPEASHKTLPCFHGLTEMGTYFGGGHVILDNYFTVGSQFVLAFELLPQHLTGLLFHVRSHKTSLNVFLMENKVGVKVNDGSGAVSVSVTPRESLCDGKFHVVTVSKQHEVIKLVVDSMSEQKAVPFASTSYSTTLDTLYIGGTTKQNRVPVSSPFVGCLRNVILNGRPVAFETASRMVGPVSINRCPAY